MLTRDDILNKKKYWDVAFNISFFEKVESKRKLANLIDRSDRDELFCKVYNFLKEMGFIQIKTKGRGKPHEIFIDYIGIVWFLREGEIGKKIVEFLRRGYDFRLIKGIRKFNLI